MLTWTRHATSTCALLVRRRPALHMRPGKRHCSMSAAGPAAAHRAASRPQVIILTGPTAVGKTAASLELAHAVGGEIISADSVQIYRGLDIGSAKVSLVDYWQSEMLTDAIAVAQETKLSA